MDVIKVQDSLILHITLLGEFILIAKGNRENKSIYLIMLATDGTLLVCWFLSTLDLL